MSKRVQILSHTQIPGDEDGPETLYRDSVVDVDDDIAGQLIAAGRAKEVESSSKLRNTAKEHLAAADEAAALAARPGDAIAALVEQRVAQALAAQMPNVVPGSDSADGK